MGAMFRDRQGLGLRKIEQLTGGEARGRATAQRHAASVTRRREMAGRGVRRPGAARCLTRMTFLPARFPARRLAQAPRAGRFSPAHH